MQANGSREDFEKDGKGAIDNVHGWPATPGLSAQAERDMTSVLAEDGTSPALFHKVKSQRSILAVAVSDSELYAGTEEGEVLVRHRKPTRAWTSVKSLVLKCSGMVFRNV